MFNELRAIETEILQRLRTPPILLPAENILPDSLARLKGTTQPDVPFNVVELSIFAQLPDEWFAENIMPSMNVWRLNMEIDPTRFRTGFHRRVALRPDGTPDVILQSEADLNPSLQPFVGQPNTVETKDHQIPMLLTYEFGFMARFQAQMILIQQQLYKRFRPLGYGAFMQVTVNPEDGETIEVPWRQTNYADLTGDPQPGEERRHEVRVTYEMLSWFDQDDYIKTGTIAISDLTVELDPC